MSAILGNSVTGAGGGAYTVDNSVRLRSSASAYLSRSVGTTSNNTTWTWSGWIKLGTLPASEAGIFGAGGGAFFNIQWWYSTPGALCIRQYNGSSDVFQLITTQLFRDPSSWYHLVVAYDSTQATSSNRIKLYVNGSQVTAFSTASYPSQNQTTYVNTSGNPMQIGRRAYGDNYWDGYIAEQRLVDGQALAASSFGETNASTGVWQPKAYAGSYGTNGFYQKYSDIATTSASNAGLGKDFSGNSNYFVTNNISVTAGVTYDAMKDSPTPASSTVGNFATLSPLNPNGSGYTSQGNLVITGANAYKSTNATIAFPSTGVWYWEGVFVQANNNLGFGCLSIGPNALANPLANTNGIAITSNGYWYLDTSTGTAGHTGWSVSTVVGMKWDSSTNTFSYTVDGTTYNTVGSVSTTDGRQWAPACWAYATNDSVALNFGQRPFTYSIPSGAKALNTFNLPTPTIGASSTTLANKYFDATLYTGTGSIQSITNAGSFQPDFVWIKNRSRGSDHLQVDAVRGVNSGLKSNGTIAQRTDTFFSSFNSNGFSLPANTLTDYWYTNISGDSEVAWQWNAGGSTVTNTSGTISSQVRANTTSGFSIVTYTGNGIAAATVGHGLNTTPKMVVIKCRSNVTDWQTWFTGFGTSGTITRAYLNLTNIDNTTNNYFYPTSTTIYMGSGDHYFNNQTYTYVAYCWAEVAGFSKFGSYTGNGSSDGTFVYTGFRPRYILVKNITTGGYNWTLHDTARSPYNAAILELFPNSSAAENSASARAFDILSNGFKLRGSQTEVNGSSNTYIYMAFAENPFNYSLAR